jgi:hypothetical protein
MNAWNTLPESYQQIVYIHTLATVKHQIQQAENPTAAVVIGTGAVSVNNHTRVDDLTSEVALEERGIASTDRNIQINNNCPHYKLHFGKPGGCGNYADEVVKNDDVNAIPTASRRRHPKTELHRFDLGTSGNQ